MHGAQREEFILTEREKTRHAARFNPLANSSHVCVCLFVSMCVFVCKHVCVNYCKRISAPVSGNQLSHIIISSLRNCKS